MTDIRKILGRTYEVLKIRPCALKLPLKCYTVVTINQSINQLINLFLIQATRPKHTRYK